LSIPKNAIELTEAYSQWLTANMDIISGTPN
jgi:hypothetical protein